jgi:hypothetical protein
VTVTRAEYVFTERLPRTPARDQLLCGLRGRAWRIPLAALYLSDGRYMPEEAKQSGCTFGLCDENGVWCTTDKATHIGWTIEPARVSG